MAQLTFILTKRSLPYSLQKNAYWAYFRKDNNIRKFCFYYPVLDIVVLLIFVWVCAWFLTRLDQEARDRVESRRKDGYAISDYEEEVRKWKRRYRLMILACIISSLVFALSCAISLLR